LSVKIPDPRIQHQKTPAWIRKIRRYLDSKGVEQTSIERVTATEGTGLNTKALRWHELADRIQERYQNATLAQLKAFYENIIGEPYPSTATQTKFAVAKSIIQQYFDITDGTALGLIARFREKLVHEGRWGLGCPHGCMRYWEFKPNDDLTGFIPVDPAAYTGEQPKVIEEAMVDVTPIKYDDEGMPIIPEEKIYEKYYLIQYRFELKWVNEIPVNRGYLNWVNGKFTCDRCGKEVNLTP